MKGAKECITTERKNKHFSKKICLDLRDGCGWKLSYFRGKTTTESAVIWKAFASPTGGLAAALLMICPDARLDCAPVQLPGSGRPFYHTFSAGKKPKHPAGGISRGVIEGEVLGVLVDSYQGTGGGGWTQVGESGTWGRGLRREVAARGFRSGEGVAGDTLARFREPLDRKLSGELVSQRLRCATVTPEGRGRMGGGERGGG